MEYNINNESTTSVDITKIHQTGQQILFKLSNVIELFSQLTTCIRKYVKDTSIQIDFGTQIQEDLQHT